MRFFGGAAYWLLPKVGVLLCELLREQYCNLPAKKKFGIVLEKRGVEKELFTFFKRLCSQYG